MKKLIIIQGKHAAGKTQIAKLIQSLCPAGTVEILDGFNSNDAEEVEATVRQHRQGDGALIVTRVLGKSGGKRGTAYLDALADVIFTVAGIEKLL